MVALLRCLASEGRHPGKNEEAWKLTSCEPSRHRRRNCAVLLAARVAGGDGRSVRDRIHSNLRPQGRRHSATPWSPEIASGSYGAGCGRALSHEPYADGFIPRCAYAQEVIPCRHIKSTRVNRPRVKKKVHPALEGTGRC